VFDGIDSASVTVFDDGVYVGQQYSFTGLPIDQLALTDDASSLAITRDGDNLIVSGNFSLEDEEAGSDDSFDLGFGQALFDSADLRVSMTFPGKIVETNGEINEDTNTITWIPKYGQANDMSAVVYSPKGLPQWVWWLVIGVLVAVVIAVGVVVFLRAPRGKKDTPPAGGTPGSPAVLQEDNPGATRRGGRPVFSYRVRPSLLAKEVFELRVFDDELDFAFVNGDRATTSDVVVIPMDSIESARVLEGRAGLGVRLVHSGKVELLPAKTSDAKTLVALVHSLRVGGKSKGAPPASASVRTTPAAATAVSSPLGSLAADIRDLHALLKEGAISDDEFNELKKRRIEQG
jgi:hypothetical protein